MTSAEVTATSVEALVAAWGSWGPTLSPDCRSVAFVSNRSGMPRLWVQDLPASGAEPPGDGDPQLAGGDPPGDDLAGPGEAEQDERRERPVEEVAGVDLEREEEEERGREQVAQRGDQRRRPVTDRVGRGGDPTMGR